jgi:oligopeptide/dipeptide ABC transporter ATP-binding protein
MPDPALRVRGLVKHFPIRRGFWQRTVARLRAVDGVDLDLAPGEALGLVGESGCGKTTLGRCVLRLIEPDAGSIEINGTDLRTLTGERLRRFRRHAQMVFQDPYGSLNPRLTVGMQIAEPLVVHGVCGWRGARDRCAALLAQVGLGPEHLDRFPHQFSGGQRQRVAIARALILDPALLVCDEPVSALDVSVQAQVLNLLLEMQEKRGCAYLFISHDLAVVGHLCHRVAVMYLGEIVETGPSQVVLARPLHPYTQALLAAVPRIAGGAKRIILPGDPPSPLDPPSAARLAKRFPGHLAAFAGGEIALREAGPGHFVRCADLAVLRQCAEHFAATGDWRAAQGP